MVLSSEANGTWLPRDLLSTTKKDERRDSVWTQLHMGMAADVSKLQVSGRLEKVSEGRSKSYSHEHGQLFSWRILDGNYSILDSYLGIFIPRGIECDLGHLTVHQATSVRLE